LRNFAEKLLNWYNSNARIMPWRTHPTPYRVWVSEMMLQQTRVDAVIPYFERFMREVPTVQALAEIPEEKLLKLWEGLGYYNRALNLKKAAKMIMENFNGEIPSDTEKLQSLPGIGAYSSGAIASIAFNKKATAVDGNVLRVMARITANKGDIADKTVKSEIEYLVKTMLPPRVGDFNQALMELGATVCIPNGLPKCSECPVGSLCKGFEQGIASSLPLKTPKKERKICEKTIFIIKYKNGFAIKQRPSSGLLPNLWEFPSAEGHYSLEECQIYLNQIGVLANHIAELNSSKHIFTHLEWHMIGYFISAEEIGQNLDFSWATKELLKHQYSVPKAFKEYLRFIDDFK